MFMDGGTVEQTCPHANSDPTEAPRADSMQQQHHSLEYRDATDRQQQPVHPSSQKPSKEMILDRKQVSLNFIEKNNY